MMWLRRAVGYGEPEQPRVSPIENNPVGWSSIYPPQVVTNPDPNVSPVVPKATMTPQALWGALLAGKRNQPVTGAELPALEQKANTAVNYGMAVAGATQPIRAFHGSPHTFDRFDMSKIGTGEGAQAYGHGLYFAGNEGVAKSYREVLAGASPELTEAYARYATPNGYLYVGRGNNAQTYSDPKWLARDAAKYPEIMRELPSELQNAIRNHAPPGSMYEVNLRTTPERLLDWDKPLSAQPPEVRAALGKLGVSGDVPKPYNGMPLGNGGTLRIVEDADFGPKMFMDLASGTSFKINQSDLANLIGKQGTEMAGKSAYTAAARAAGGDSAASAALRDVGLDGLQYLDAGSRAAGDGSRNYVMFRDDIIDILKRYGLFGLGMMGAAGAQGGKEQ